MSPFEKTQHVVSERMLLFEEECTNVEDTHTHTLEGEIVGVKCEFEFYIG